jgi:hypothetical protein
MLTPPVEHSSGFYSSLLSQHQCSLGFPPQLDPIRNGTANFERIWAYMLSITPLLLATDITETRSLWKRIGLLRFGIEFNRLSISLLTSLTNYYMRAATGTTTTGDPQKAAFDQPDSSDAATMSNLIDFLQTFSI